MGHNWFEPGQAPQYISTPVWLCECPLFSQCKSCTYHNQPETLAGHTLHFQSDRHGRCSHHNPSKGPKGISDSNRVCVNLPFQYNNQKNLTDTLFINPQGYDADCKRYDGVEGLPPRAMQGVPSLSLSSPLLFDSAPSICSSPIPMSQKAPHPCMDGEPSGTSDIPAKKSYLRS